MKSTLLCREFSILQNIKKADVVQTFLSNLSIAQAIRTPLQKRFRNKSVDYSMLNPIYQNMNREILRTRFLYFLRELWFTLMPNRGDWLIKKILEADPTLGNADVAMDTLLDKFADAVYKTIFCDWISSGTETIDSNIMVKVNIAPSNQKQCNVSFYSSLFHAKGKIKCIWKYFHSYNTIFIY